MMKKLFGTFVFVLFAGCSAAPTPAVTSATVDLSTCVEFRIIELAEDSSEDGYTRFDDYIGKCIKAIRDPFMIRDSISGVDHSGNILIKFTPLEDVPRMYGYIWGIFKKNEDFKPEGGPLHTPVYELEVIKMETIPYNVSPKNAGTHTVGDQKNILPGEWTSDNAGWKNSKCTWSRLASGSGEILESHSGIFTVPIKLFEGDIFETNKGCGKWFYVGP